MKGSGIRARVVRARYILPVVGAVALATVAVARARGRPQPGQPSPPCTVREISRQTLALADGREMYVEPVALAASEHGVLLAGSPNFSWVVGRSGKKEVSREIPLGVILSRDGSARRIPSPSSAARVVALRAAARQGGTWAVLFAEVGMQAVRREGIAALWYGVYDGRQWSGLQRLPLPADGDLDRDVMSALASHGDSLGWAIRVWNGSYSDVAFYEFDGRAWKHEVIPTRRMAYVDAAHAPGRGWTLAVVMPDTLLPSDANSLYLYQKAPQWTVLRKVDSGHRGPIHDPRLVVSPDGDGTLSWWAAVSGGMGPNRQEARASLDPLGARPRIFTVDSAAGALTSLHADDGTSLWVTEHQDRSDGKSVIRFLARGTGPVREAGRLRNPFDGRFAVVALPGSSDLLVLGEASSPSRDVVTSLIIRARVECGSRRP